jgi:hypothetical protein
MPDAEVLVPDDSIPLLHIHRRTIIYTGGTTAAMVSALLVQLVYTKTL